MKKMVLLLFVACGLSVMADPVPLRTDRKIGFGNFIRVLRNEQKSDGDRLWEVCFDDADGSKRVERLRQLLSQGCDPNAPTSGNKLVMTELINGRSKFDETDCRMLELLLKHGADVRKGVSLCKLCGQKYDRAKGRLKAVELLLDKGLDPNEVDNSGNSILKIIVDRGGNDVGDADLVNLLLRRGADPKKGAVSLCELCCKFGLEQTNRVAIVSALLEKGMNVNEVGKRGLSVLGTVINNAMIEKDERLALAKLLLNHGADVNAMIGFGAFRKTILDEVLSRHGRDEALQSLFLQYAADLKTSRVSLHDLYRSGDFTGETGIRKLESLLSKGCDPNERSLDGASLLMAVAEGRRMRRSGETNDLAIAKVLLAHGADPNASSTFGGTALGNVVARSAFNGQLTFAKLLLDKGADPNAADDFGNTPFMKLFGSRFDETKLGLMKLLFEHGASVKGGEWHKSILDQVGNWQVGTQKLEIVRMLVKKGAPVTDRAICSAWRDEPLRRYLLEQSGQTEDDFEIGSSESTFSVRTKKKDGHGAESKYPLPIRSAHGLRRTGHADSVRQLEETMAKLQQIRDRRHKRSTTFVITLVAVIAFAIMLAVALSFWRRGRRGVRGYGTCQHESGVVTNYFRCLGRYADFSGRADRSEYWSFALTNALLTFLIRLSGSHELEVVFAVVMLVPGLAAATRRLHDVGRSGLRLLFFLVPLVIVGVFGNMPMRQVNELGWDEDLFTTVMSLSFCMVLVFGIWNLVLLLRKGVEDDSCDNDRQVDHEIGANEGEPVEMIAVSKDEIDMIEASEKRELEEGGSTCKS